MIHFGHIASWWVAGAFAVFACYLSVNLIRRHLANYTEPSIQKYIIRIALMVPVYAIGSWLSLRYKEHALYIDLVRDCYEAFVIYSFVWMLSAYAGGDERLLNIISKHSPMHHMFPINLFYSPSKLDRTFIRKNRQAVLQYVIVKPIVTALAIVLDGMDLYDEGEFRLDRGYLYLTAINSISVTIAMNSLLEFYHALAGDMKHINPLMKLLCIKGVLFLSTWQGIICAVLAKVHIIHSTASYSVDQVEIGLQDFLMCFEMAVVAMAHDLAYSEREFIKPAKAKPTSLWAALTDALSVKNTVADVKAPFSRKTK